MISSCLGEEQRLESTVAAVDPGTFAARRDSGLSAIIIPHLPKL